MGCSLQGVLAQAKYGELFWEDKFHAANGKAQPCTQGALHFFFLSLGEGVGRRIFFSFFPGSQCVVTKFPSSSHWVPNGFRKFPMCSPNIFSMAPHLYPICFVNCCPPFTYTSVACAVGPSVTMSSTDFSFQNLVF